MERAFALTRLVFDSFVRLGLLLLITLWLGFLCLWLDFYFLFLVFLYLWLDFCFFSVSSVFSLVRFSFSLVSLSFSAVSFWFVSTSSVVSVGLVCFSWKLVDFWASFGFSWVSLEDFPSEKKEPIRWEIFLRGSKSSNLRSSNFWMRSARSLIDFKSSSLLGGRKQWDLKYLVFLFSHYSYFLQYERHS